MHRTCKYNWRNYNFLRAGSSQICKVAKPGKSATSGPNSMVYNPPTAQTHSKTERLSGWFLVALAYLEAAAKDRGDN